MAFAKFQENRLRIDGEIAENHAILVNLTASIVVTDGQMFTRVTSVSISTSDTGHLPPIS